jgi:mannose-6-phosphate isomerase-like protein (cupin superfamily)
LAELKRYVVGLDGKGTSALLMDGVPNHQEPDTAQKTFAEINRMVGHTQAITDKDRQRNPSMHRTNTLDVITVLGGEVYIVLDEDEILLKPTDTVIIQGTNHGWSNRSDEPCLAIGVMIDAIPRQ